MEAPRKETLQSASELMSADVLEWRPIIGGYSANKRWLVTLDNCQTLFAKEAVDTDTSEWLSTERQMYEAIDADFMPRFYGYDDSTEFPVLFIEDLSKGDWSASWTQEKIEQVKDTIERINSTKAPSFVGTLEEESPRLSGWYEVVADNSGFVSLGIASQEWADENLPKLAAAEARANWQGEELLHLDIRSDNLCFINGKVKVVDWNLPKVGNGIYDLLFWLPSLALEGGPKPWKITLKEPELIAAVAGFFAKSAPKPDPWEGSKIRGFQLQQLEVALPWACKALGIAEPTKLN